MFKKICFCLLLCVCVASLTGCKKAQFDESKNTIVIGLECDYPPFNWLETSKTDTNVPIDGVAGSYAEGYDVQIAKMIAEDLGYTLVIKMISWDGLIPALNSGMIDAIIAGMSPRSDRKEAINFTVPYYESTHVILVKANSPYASAQTFADLSGAKVMGQDGTTYDTLARQINEKNSNTTYLNPLATVPEIVNAINTGMVDITVLEEPVAQGIVSAHPDYTYITLTTPFEIAEEDAVVSIGVRKIDEKLLAALNASLSKISTATRNSLMQQAIDANEAS